MDKARRDFVRARAGNRCEYCGLRQDESPLASLQIEHIVPRKHRGTDDADNLALACIDCNLHKGSNIAGIDPTTGEMTELFHPRHHVWTEHFEWTEVVILGMSDIGRTTVQVLDLNSEERIELRGLRK